MAYLALVLSLSLSVTRRGMLGIRAAWFGPPHRRRISDAQGRENRQADGWPWIAPPAPTRQNWEMM